MLSAFESSQVWEQIMLQKRKQMRILVIGAGVSGLTTALCLLRHGYQVTVIAERFKKGLVTAVAGALWEWPPAVCGYHPDNHTMERSKDWCTASYEVFSCLANDPTTGVSVRPVVFYFKERVKDNPIELAKMNQVQQHVREFWHSPSLIADNGINENIGLVDAYTHLAPTIDTDTYVVWLRAQIAAAGGQFQTRKITGDLKALESKLKAEFGVDAIVNCTGLGAQELCKDDMYPLRGALLRAHNDGKKIPKVTKAHCISYNRERDAQQHMVYIVPRGHNTLLIGGLAEPEQWDTNINQENYEPVRRMFERCVQFMPVLKDIELDQQETVRAGLRPLRRGSHDVRLEREANTYIVHNYGHGGAGVTYSWGCAMEVVNLIEQIL